MPSWHTVVPIPSFAVHAHPDALFQEKAGEGLTGELCPLVGVEYLRPSLTRACSKAATQKSVSRVLESFQASTYRLCQSMMATRACPERSRRVQEALSHGDVGNVCRPDLVNPIDFQAFQEIRVHFMSQCRLLVLGRR